MLSGYPQCNWHDIVREFIERQSLYSALSGGCDLVEKEEEEKGNPEKKLWIILTLCKFNPLSELTNIQDKPKAERKDGRLFNTILSGFFLVIVLDQLITLRKEWPRTKSSHNWGFHVFIRLSWMFLSWRIIIIRLLLLFWRLNWNPLSP